MKIMAYLCIKCSLKKHFYLMKHLTLFLFLFAGMSCHHAPAAAAPAETEEAPASEQIVDEEVPQERRDVLYYYRRLKEPYRSGYELKERNGTWTTQSPDTGEPIASVVVDIKNGFIEILDEGTGGGEWTYRMALFRMADGNPVIGITKTYFDGAGLDQKYYFLRPEDSRKSDWTKETIKEVSGFDFLPLDNAEEERIVNALLPVSLELPRQGTSLKATVYTGLEYIYCRGDDNEYADYCGLFKQLRRKEIVFKWNREKGKFE